MAEVFDIEYRGDHVHVQLGPGLTVDPDWRTEFWARIRTACTEHDSCRVLVEGLVPGGEHSTAEVIDAGKHTAVIPNLWLALHLEGFVPSEQSELFEVIAASHGVRAKFFSDTERALNWLRSNAPG